MESWIKLNDKLFCDPRVMKMAEMLDGCDVVKEVFGDKGFYVVNGDGPSGVTVTLRVTMRRNAVVGALALLWSKVRLTGKDVGGDAMVKHASLSWVDDVVGIEGFGDLLTHVSWLQELDSGLCFPGFFRENNQTPGATSNAERQRRFRQRKKESVTPGVTSNVTRNTEKSRGEKSRSKKESSTKTSKKFTKPTVEEIQSYCDERGNGLSGQAIWDHYEANGWKRGKTPIKDWKACVRTWENQRREQAEQETKSDLPF